MDSRQAPGDDEVRAIQTASPRNEPGARQWPPALARRLRTQGIPDVGPTGADLSR